ncbi:uncharacterized protein [Nicotiana tomentosiformis]|uniref:uncharacterized protein n=1 Tax=Nicotiana tomentosiformis TaxID=4098 RepID=UPI00388C517A
MHEAWLVIDDFNNVLSVNDRLNGKPVQQAELVDFQECIKYIGLGQLNRKGCQWSWYNKRDAESRIYNNIDWAFRNASWLTHYSSLEAVFELPGVSDHFPIIINTDVAKNYLPKPFRLYNVMLNHKELEGAVHEVWNQQVHGHTMHSIWLKLQRLKDKTKHMNKEMSSLDKKIGQLREQLQNTQGELDEDPFNIQLITNENELLL